VLQGVLWTVARKLAWLNDPDAFKPWIYRIATRAALKHVTRERRVWRFQSHQELDAVAAPEGPTSPPRADEIPALLAGVTPRSRAVIVLHYLDDLSLDEIAAVLALPVGTVKSRLSYGLRTMRQAAEKSIYDWQTSRADGCGDRGCRTDGRRHRRPAAAMIEEGACRPRRAEG